MLFDLMGHEAILANALGVAINRWLDQAAEAREAGNGEIEAMFLRQVAQAQNMGERLEEATGGRVAL